MAQRARHWIRVVLRLVALLTSAATLAVTGYGWWIQRGLAEGITTTQAVTSPALEPKPLNEEFTALLVGLDSRTDADGAPLSPEVLAQLRAGEDEGQLNTDTIILLHVPADPGRHAVAISIPRDSYVPIAGGRGRHKINSAYRRAANEERHRLEAFGLHGIALERLSREAGRRALVATVEELTGVQIDHYAEINLVGFVELTEAIGGVPVCLRNPVREPRSGVDLPAGFQLISGADALAFVRQRHGLPAGDLDRIARQRAFLAGLARRVLSAGTLADPVRTARLISVITENVVIDHTWDLRRLAHQLGRFSAADVEFHTIPTGRTDLQTPADGIAVAIDPDEVRAFVQRTINGRNDDAHPTATPARPTTRTTTSATPNPEPITAADVTCVD